MRMHSLRLLTFVTLIVLAACQPVATAIPTETPTAVPTVDARATATAAAVAAAATTSAQATGTSAVITRIAEGMATASKATANARASATAAQATAYANATATERARPTATPTPTETPTPTPTRKPYTATPPPPPTSSVASACAVSSDRTYGYAPENPVKVGGDWLAGPGREEQYLSVLRGPDGQAVSYERRGSVPQGNTILDLYVLTYAGQPAAAEIYIDEYTYEELRAPMGFICAAPFPLGPP